MNSLTPQLAINLFKKLVSVRKEIKNVKKSGFNKHQNYNYITEADLVEAVKDSLNKHGILLFSSSEITDIRETKKVDKEGKEVISGFLTSVKTVHTFVDSETGESHSVVSAGQGHDIGDKGVFKSITGSYKYFLSKNFLIESDDDPEGDGVNKPTTETTRTSFNKPIVTQTSDKGSTNLPTELTSEVASKPEASSSNGTGFKRQGFSRPQKTEPKF